MVSGPRTDQIVIKRYKPRQQSSSAPNNPTKGSRERPRGSTQTDESAHRGYERQVDDVRIKIEPTDTWTGGINPKRPRDEPEPAESEYSDNADGADDNSIRSSDSDMSDYSESQRDEVCGVDVDDADQHVPGTPKSGKRTKFLGEFSIDPPAGWLAARRRDRNSANNVGDRKTVSSEPGSTDNKPLKCEHVNPHSAFVETLSESAELLRTNYEKNGKIPKNPIKITNDQTLAKMLKSFAGVMNQLKGYLSFWDAFPCEDVVTPNYRNGIVLYFCLSNINLAEVSDVCVHWFQALSQSERVGSLEALVSEIRRNGHMKFPVADAFDVEGRPTGNDADGTMNAMRLLLTYFASEFGIKPLPWSVKRSEISRAASGAPTVANE